VDAGPGAPAEDESDEHAHLALTRLSTRFVDPAVERAYQDWFWARSRKPILTALCATLLLSIALHGTLLATMTERLLVWSWAFVVGYAVQALAVWVVASHRLAWMPRAVALVGYVMAPVGIALALDFQDVDGGAAPVALAIFGCLFILSAPSDGRFVLNAPPALGIVAIVEVSRAIAWSEGSISTTALAFDSCILWATGVSGILLHIGAAASQHVAYRQERIIETQKRTIAEERARREELLQREVAHQVAERSRELGATLARSSESLDVRRLAPGERFATRYRIVSSLGAGGMGVVYEVERLPDGARLALKAVVGEISGAGAARFAREAEIGARVRHANLVPILDVGISVGVPFLVMELASDGSLERERPRFGDVDWALSMLRQIAAGLAALHEAGVVHRDLKPANVLLSEGTAKISDFGISRFGSVSGEVTIDASADTVSGEQRAHDSNLTGTGVLLGTPLYMAPEAASGGRELDTAADVFALGIIAYELVTGRMPFAAPPFVVALAGQGLPPPPPIDDARVPDALRELILECLALDPARRPRVQSVLSALSGATLDDRRRDGDRAATGR
jgi:hypothetical protein